jgi:prevent-host-death family protein
MNIERDWAFFARANCQRDLSRGHVSTYWLIRLDLLYLTGYISQMEKVSVSKLKDQLSAYLKKVQDGQTLLVTDRNKPVARLEPLAQPGSETQRIARLAEQGIVALPKAPPLGIEEIRRMRPTAPGANLLEALLEERESGP